MRLALREVVDQHTHKTKAQKNLIPIFMLSYHMMHALNT